MNIEKRKEKPKVVLDTNVIISGLNFRGRPREILDLIRGEQIELYISPFILEEVKGVLKEKFSWNEERIQTAIEKFKAALVEPEENILVIKKDRDDNRILECAVEGKAGYIVSGDKRHLLPLREYQGIKILSPAQFLRIISQETSSGSF
ncbi:MAG: putative toxin-antitoxin system toxin component, PIN family [Candidatus Aerophobetes bacterium]|nr:putative toxin-antitoxin system toxin component, PIN family [Candidatus Aerophobetes bacterium]